jgi:hypothetical protein
MALSRCALVAAWARLACSKSFTDLNSEPQSPRSKTAQHARPLSDLRCCSARRDRPFRLACGAVETITASVMLSSILHQGHAAFAARSAGTGVYRRPTDADPNTSSACDSKRPPDGLPLQGGDRSDARQHQVFAAKLTPGGGLLESGTKKSGDSGWLGSTR